MVHIKDVLVIGASASGLWTSHYLAREGYDVGILQNNSGENQTVASQGVIHTGVKYGFSGECRLDSVAELVHMPARWDRCLLGQGDIDLRKVKVLADKSFLWYSKNASVSAEGPLNRDAGKLLQVPLMETEDVPAIIAANSPRAYRIAEKVIDTRSLLEALAEGNKDRIMLGDVVDARKMEDGKYMVRVNNGGVETSIIAGAVVLTAGRGNAGLAKKFGIEGDIMQERGLRQLIVKGYNLPPIYGICVDGNVPKAIFTTHSDRDGRTVWNIGGKIAEKGSIEPAIPEIEFIASGKTELEGIFPSFDFSGTQWESYPAVRAEGMSGGMRPGGFHLGRKGNVWYGWPTKVTLVPIMADAIVAEIKSANLSPSAHNTEFGSSALPIIQYPWN